MVEKFHRHTSRRSLRTHSISYDYPLTDGTTHYEKCCIKQSHRLPLLPLAHRGPLVAVWRDHLPVGYESVMTASSSSPSSSERVPNPFLQSTIDSSKRRSIRSVKLSFSRLWALNRSYTSSRIPIIFRPIICLCVYKHKDVSEVAPAQQMTRLSSPPGDLNDHCRRPVLLPHRPCCGKCFCGGRSR